MGSGDNDDQYDDMELDEDWRYGMGARATNVLPDVIANAHSDNMG